MKVISRSADLNKQLLRLIDAYPHVSIATAWASSSTEVFQSLLKRRDRIERAIIGTHFYQTDPDVLDAFVGSRTVQFVLQPTGVFHPKVYLFWSDDAWELIIGSPNLTMGALTRNSELSILVSSKDGQDQLKDEILKAIRVYEGLASTVSQQEADNYRHRWKHKQRELKRIADVFGDQPSAKPAVRSRVMSMEWDEYLTELQKEKTHGFKDRLAMLEVVRDLFKKHKHFNDIPIDARRGVAGLESKAFADPKWFGSMRGAGTFYKLINNEEKALSLALDEIPRVGEVRRAHFDGRSQV